MVNTQDIDPFEGVRQHTSCQWLEDRTIFVTVHGSHAYGTNIATSDVDLKGLAIPPADHLVGLKKEFEQTESSEPYDVVFYGLHKFLRLASQCNPNIIEILFTDPQDWVVSTEAHRKLHENRHLFLSKVCRNTFGGYARQQLKRIKSHKAWLLNPPTHRPTREEYGLPKQSKMSQSDLGATEKLLNEGVALDEKVMALYHREQEYQRARKQWDQYQRWLRERNESRAALEAQYGYDTKHAMHLVRLMRMAHEILTTGEVHVKRPDAAELLEVRNGDWPYEQLLGFADHLEQELKDAVKTSDLPEKPDTERINELCKELTLDALNW